MRKRAESNRFLLDPQYEIQISIQNDFYARILGTIQAVAFDHLDASRSTLDMKTSVQQLISGMKLLSESKVWPYEREPYPMLRDDLISALISTGSYLDALRHMIFRYFVTTPLVMPDPHDQARIVHTQGLVKLLTFVATDPSFANSGIKFNPIVVAYCLSLEIMRNMNGFLKPDHHMHKYQAKKFERLKMDIAGGNERRLKQLENLREKEFPKFKAFGDVLF
jgi:hypothetical protein